MISSKYCRRRAPVQRAKERMKTDHHAAHLSVVNKRLVAEVMPTTPKKTPTHILAHPRVCGWHSTTLGSAQTASRLLRKASRTPGERLATPATTTPIAHTHRSSHILHGQGRHNFYEIPTRWSAIRDLVRPTIIVPENRKPKQVFPSY